MMASGRKCYSFENVKYMEKLTRCAIHMDQGASYNPEYLATRDMSLYPSRTAQVIRAVWLGELEATRRGAQIAHASILSGQGERWQNFGEEASDFLHCAILGRELFAKKGFPCGASKESLALAESPGRKELWERSIGIDPDGDCLLFVDDASFEYTDGAPAGLGGFLGRHCVKVRGINFGATGFALLAHGFVDEGFARLSALIDELNRSGAKKVVTASGQATYALTKLACELGISRGFEVADVLDIADAIDSEGAFLYGGSFYTRFLGASGRLAELSKNTREASVRSSPEFTPLYDADKRVNGINIWGAPIGPEYIYSRGGGGMLEKIRDAALDEIKRSSFSQLIVCEPFAYNTLKTSGFARGRTEYFWNVLK
ncbi:MAG: hypothetical protein LBQ36_09690 [Synergistaceae bacterium]|jgi:hypothetical protein|nr:hypothetical protein [Synergistaceae bacterium]